MMAKKNRPKQIPLAKFLEDHGITSMVSPPMDFSPGVVVYDCLLRCQRRCSVMHLRIRKEVAAPMPGMFEVMTHAISPTLLAVRFQNDIDAFADCVGGPMSDVLDRWTRMHEDDDRLHDFLGCDLYGVVTQNLILMEELPE